MWSCSASVNDHRFFGRRCATVDAAGIQEGEAFHNDPVSVAVVIELLIAVRDNLFPVQRLAGIPLVALGDALCVQAGDGYDVPNPQDLVMVWSDERERVDLTLRPPQVDVEFDAVLKRPLQPEDGRAR